MTGGRGEGGAARWVEAGGAWTCNHGSVRALEQLLRQGLSLAEIGRRLERHESTVAYWVRQYGLRAVNQGKHAATGGLERDELEVLIEDGVSIQEMADALGRSKATVRYWLAKHGLRAGRSRGRRSRVGAREARAAGVSEAVIECPHHGRTRHVRESRGYFRRARCREAAVIKRRRRTKEILVAEAGGRCRL